MASLLPSSKSYFLYPIHLLENNKYLCLVLTLHFNAVHSVKYNVALFVAMSDVLSFPSGITLRERLQMYNFHIFMCEKVLNI